MMDENSPGKRGDNESMDVAAQNSLLINGNDDDNDNNNDDDNINDATIMETLDNNLFLTQPDDLDCLFPDALLDECETEQQHEVSSSSGQSVFTRVTIQLPTQTPTSWIQVAPPTLYSRGCSPKKQVSYLVEADVHGSPKKQTPCFVEAGNGVSPSQLPSVPHTSPSSHTHFSQNFHHSTQSSMNKVIEEELAASFDYLTLCQENEKIKTEKSSLQRSLEVLTVKLKHLNLKNKRQRNEKQTVTKLKRQLNDVTLKNVQLLNRIEQQNQDYNVLQVEQEALSKDLVVVKDRLQGFLDGEVSSKLSKLQAANDMLLKQRQALMASVRHLEGTVSSIRTSSRSQTVVIDKQHSEIKEMQSKLTDASSQLQVSREEIIALQQQQRDVVDTASSPIPFPSEITIVHSFSEASTVSQRALSPRPPLLRSSSSSSSSSSPVILSSGLPALRARPRYAYRTPDQSDDTEDMVTEEPVSLLPVIEEGDTPEQMDEDWSASILNSQSSSPATAIFPPSYDLSSSSHFSNIEARHHAARIFSIHLHSGLFKPGALVEAEGFVRQIQITTLSFFTKLQHMFPHFLKGSHKVDYDNMLFIKNLTNLLRQPRSPMALRQIIFSITSSFEFPAASEGQAQWLFPHFEFGSVFANRVFDLEKKAFRKTALRFLLMLLSPFFHQSWMVCAVFNVDYDKTFLQNVQPSNTSFTKGSVYFLLLLAVAYSHMHECPYKFGRPAISSSGVLEIDRFAGHPTSDHLRTLQRATSFPEQLLSRLLSISPADYYEEGMRKLVNQDKEHMRKLFKKFLVPTMKKKIEQSMTCLRRTRPSL